MSIRCGSLTDWMKEEIQKQNSYCGIDKWHDKDMKGKGVAVWVTEGFSDHGCQTHDRVLDAAPYANVINAYISGTWNNDKIKNLKVVKVDFDTNEEIEYNIEDFIKIHKIKIVSNSIGSGLAKKGVEYGVDRLANHLIGQLDKDTKPCANIQKSLLEFSGNKEREDDLTIFTLKIKGK